MSETTAFFMDQSDHVYNLLQSGDVQILPRTSPQRPRPPQIQGLICLLHPPLGSPVHRAEVVAQIIVGSLSSTNYGGQKLRRGAGVVRVFQIGLMIEFGGRHHEKERMNVS